MTDFSPMPDLEAVCSDAIKAASIRAYSSIPAKAGTATVPYPFVTVKRLGGIPVERHRIDQARIQVDSWGDNKKDAWRTAEAARRAILGLEGTKSPKHEAVITGVEDDLGTVWLPDPDTGRDRYIFAMLVYGHHLDS